MHFCFSIHFFFLFCFMLSVGVLIHKKSFTLIHWLFFTKKLKWIFRRKKAQNLRKLWGLETVVNFLFIFFNWPFLFQTIYMCYKKITHKNIGISLSLQIFVCLKYEKFTWTIITFVQANYIWTSRCDFVIIKI